MGESISSHFVGLTGGILMSLIAFSIVFLVIIGLMLMMMALKHFASAIDGGQKAKAAPQGGAPAAPAAKGNAPAAAVAATDDGELIAVIAAAVTAACGGAARVVSFRPVAVSGNSAWRMTGILQNTEGFVD